MLLGLLGGFLFLRVEGRLFLGFLVALSDLVHGLAPECFTGRLRATQMRYALVSHVAFTDASCKGFVR